ncbi:MAG: hypothetical protein LBT86_05145 [Deltaproteobacteria bacterium]|nr:hypothetical protein [Deltaproteobacteria bacterium]
MVRINIVLTFSFIKEKLMKKLLALALGAMLCTALAMPAQAQTKVSFSGWYRVLHHNLVNFNRAADSDLYQSDSFFEHRLHLNVDFRPNDNILVHWTLRAPNFARWGANAGAAANSEVGQTNAFPVYTRAIYATITQDWGKLSIGRLEETFPTSMNGLKSLGYSYGTTYIYANPFDYKQVADGIVYNYNMDNGFGVNVYYAKLITTDTTTTNTAKDSDWDRFGVEPTFKWDGGGAALNLEYQRDMRSVNTEKNYSFFVNPALMQSWGDFSIRFEAKIGWGETTFANTLVKQKTEGLGLFLQASYKYGAGDVNLMAWFADGTSAEDNKRGKRNDLVGMGDFAPFLVAYYNVTLANKISTATGNGSYGGSIYGTANRGQLGVNGGRGAGGPSNHMGIGLLGNHNFTDTIRFNWGIGAFQLVEPPTSFPGLKKDLGVEVDLGVRVQLLKGVTFESQFGYMFNGEAWANGTYGELATYKDAKDTFAWLNALQFAF